MFNFADPLPVNDPVAVTAASVPTDKVFVILGDRTGDYYAVTVCHKTTPATMSELGKTRILADGISPVNLPFVYVVGDLS